MFATPEFWAAISFVGFIGLIQYFKVPNLIVQQLDKRSEHIKAELDEAQQLRETAQALLAEYQRKRLDAEKEAESIIAAAKDVALRYNKEARSVLEENVHRRMQSVKSKIEQAERQAIVSIHTTAADIAISASQLLISQKMTRQMHSDLLDVSLVDAEDKLN